MVPQVFESKDIITVGLLVILEALLSADNALILAIIVRHLPKEQQKKALFYGIGGAFILRLLAVVLASQLIGFWWLQAIGAFYLLWLPIKHFAAHAKSKMQVHEPKKAGFWMTVLYAELADIAFAIDSVLVAVAIEPHKNKIWVVYVGAILGIILLRWAAGVFLRVMEKYPILDHIAYLLVGWAGCKLAMHAGHNFWVARNEAKDPLPFYIPGMHPAVFWSVLALIVIVGGLVAVRQPKLDEPVEDPSRAADQIEEVLDGEEPPAK